MAEPRLDYEAKLDDLLKLYRQAQRTIAAQVRAAILDEDLRSARIRAAQLAEVLKVLEDLGVSTDGDAVHLVNDAWHESADRVAEQIVGLHIDAPEIPGTFAGISRDSLVALEDSILGRLGDARRTVGRTVDDIYGRAGRRAAVRAVLGADGSPDAARKALMRDLTKDRTVARLIEKGGVAFVDRAGRGWTLESYSDMAVRTVTREAVTQGALARMAAHGINLARVSRHADACIVCKPWEGRLVSLDGQTADYEGEAVTDLASLPNGGPPFHPRCRHSLQPVSVRLDQFRRELAAQT
jgi:hypothetical protein